MIVYNADMTAPYDVGTEATYSCNPGYELVLNPGSEMRSCEDAGDGIAAVDSVDKLQLANVRSYSD